jgi:integrase
LRYAPLFRTRGIAYSNLVRRGYKRQLELYIDPFFGDMFFSDLNPSVFLEFVVWAKEQQYRGKPVSNKTINKCLAPLRLATEEATIRYNWGATFNPFFGYKRLPEKDGDYKIEPFSLKEQEQIINSLPHHWKPYFQFSFCSGLRQGEQFALNEKDIGCESGTISKTKALTLDKNGSRTTGNTKNKYSRRIFGMSPAMRKVLKEQVTISNKLQSEYLFCTKQGNLLNHANLCNRVWIPALKKANISFYSLSPFPKIIFNSSTIFLGLLSHVKYLLRE